MLLQFGMKSMQFEIFYGREEYFQEGDNKALEISFKTSIRKGGSTKFIVPIFKSAAEGPVWSCFGFCPVY